MLQTRPLIVTEPIYGKEEANGNREEINNYSNLISGTTIIVHFLILMVFLESLTNLRLIIHPDKWRTKDPLIRPVVNRSTT